MLVFDQEQLKRERGSVEKIAEALKAELLCLDQLQTDRAIQSSQTLENIPPSDRFAAQISPTTSAQHAKLAPRCARMITTQKTSVRAFELKQRDITAEIEIISNFIDTSTSGPLRLDIVQAQDVLERRLALALARHSLTAQLHALELDFARQRQEFEDSRTKLAAKISLEIAEVEATKTRLSQLIRAPRIQAPVAGRVLRLRQITPGQVLPNDTEVLSILPAHNDGYRIAFETEPKHLSFLKVGQNLQVDVLGLPHKAMTIDASIQQFVTSTAGGITVVAQVSPASQVFLAKSPYSQQIRDASSAVAIHAYRYDVSLVTAVRTTALALLPEAFWWRTPSARSDHPPMRSAQSSAKVDRRLPVDLF